MAILAILRHYFKKGLSRRICLSNRVCSCDFLLLTSELFLATQPCVCACVRVRAVCGGVGGVWVHR